jgi:DNA processing protein
MDSSEELSAEKREEMIISSLIKQNFGTPKDSRKLNGYNISIAKDYRKGCELGVSYLLKGDILYPSRLQAVDDSPEVICCLNPLPSNFQELTAVGIVGTRRASASGIRFANRIAAELTEQGVVIVSGFAAGIDGAAHRGALSGALGGALGGASKNPLKSGFPGVAVLGGGVNYLYPAEHKMLKREFLQAGGVMLSEYGANTHPTKFTFPRRNRIISALSDLIVVVEAGERSGALLTVRYAMEQGKDIGVVPGAIDSPQSVGALRLLKQGAAPILCTEDILELLPKWKKQNSVKKLAKKEQKSLVVKEYNVSGLKLDIIKTLQAEEDCSFDLLVNRLKLDPSTLRAQLMELELDSHIEAREGDRFGLVRG